MAEPIVFISHSRVKEGRLDGLREYMRPGTAALEAAKPRTLVFAAYLDEDQRELTIVHVFADAESMDAHLEGVAERARAAMEFIESSSMEIYGRPSDAVLATMRGVTVPGVTLTLHPNYVAGFIRLAAGAA